MIDSIARNDNVTLNAKYLTSENSSDIYRIIDLLKCALSESNKIRNREISYFIDMAILSAEEMKR